MIRKQDIGVLFLYYLGYSSIRNKLLRLKKTPITRFVAFHDILPAAIGRFRNNLLFLKKNTNVISLDDYFLGNIDSKKINVVITFDDGYKGWVHHAAPILKEYGLPAIFFISSGFIGLNKTEEEKYVKTKLFSNPKYFHEISGCMSYEDVKQLSDLGFLIGGHTLNHCNMEKIKSTLQLRREIEEDKIKLNDIAGCKIKYFAYPSGACNNKNIDLVKLLKDAGYKGAVTTASGLNGLGENPFMLRRELTSSMMSGPVFKARVYGNYDGINCLKTNKYSKALIDITQYYRYRR